MVAAVAAKLGLKCVLVQENWVDYSDAVYDRVGNIMMSRLMGADVRLVDQGFDIGFRRSWEEALEDVRRRGGKPYAIPAGASDHELGGLGYVGFAEEVRRQEAGLGFKFDYIVVCAVTGSTQPAWWWASPTTVAPTAWSASTPRPRRTRRERRSCASRAAPPT